MIDPTHLQNMPNGTPAINLEAISVQEEVISAQINDVERFKKSITEEAFICGLCTVAGIIMLATSDNLIQLIAGTSTALVGDAMLGVTLIQVAKAKGLLEKINNIRYT